VIAQDIKRYAAGESVTIESLQAMIISRLPSSLSQADKVLALALVETVMVELRARVAGNLLSPDRLLVVEQVGDWVIEATEIASPSG
jgi:hypothetical protein